MTYFETLGGETDSLLEILGILKGNLPALSSNIKSFNDISSDLNKIKQYQNFVREIESKKPDYVQKFCSRYEEIQTNWDQIAKSLEWSKELVQLFGEKEITDAFCTFVCSKVAEQIQSKSLKEKRITYESRFLGPRF